MGSEKKGSKASLGHPEAPLPHLSKEPHPGGGGTEKSCHLPSAPLTSCDTSQKWILGSVVSSVAKTGVNIKRWTSRMDSVHFLAKNALHGQNIQHM